MLENLKSLISEHAGDAIINNPAIPNEQNEEAITTASDSIVKGLKEEVSGGHVSGVMNLFNGGEQAVATSPLTQKIQGSFVENLMHKFGLDQGKAMQIGATLIPMVLKKFVNKTNDPNDKSFDLSSIISSLTGGGAGIGGKDLLNNLGGGSDQEGGVLGKLKGLF